MAHRATVPLCGISQQHDSVILAPWCQPDQTGGDQPQCLLSVAARRLHLAKSWQGSKAAAACSSVVPSSLYGEGGYKALKPDSSWESQEAWEQAPTA